MPRRTLPALLLVCSLTYACNSDDDDKTVPAQACKSQDLCDITEPSCVESLLELTACVRENDVPPLPDIEHLTSTEASARLASELMAEGAMATTPWDPALRALSLLPPGTSSIEAAVAQFIESVAAYYDPETKRVTILTDSAASTDTLSQMYVMSHELTHYIQDEEHDLLRMQDESESSTDRAVALSSLVEGDAVVTSTRVLIKLMNRSANNFAWENYFGVLQDDMLFQIEASPAPLAEAVQDLPYTVGGLAVAQRWKAQGREGVDELFETWPQAMTDWLDRELDPEDSGVAPLACAPPLAPEGFTLYELDSFGSVGAFAMLVAAGAGDLDLAASLRSDAIALYVTDDAEEPGSARVIAVWRLRFQSADRAQSFERALAGTSARLEIRRRGDELSIRASSDPEASALRGTTLDACPKLTELEPANETPDMPRAFRRSGFRR